MRTSRLLSSFMIVALLFIVFHDFAVNKAASVQQSTQIMTQETLQQDTPDVTTEHQSFHQPFLVTSDTAYIYSPEPKEIQPHDDPAYIHPPTFDIFSPPKA